MKGFGFGDRSGIELPSETRGAAAGAEEVGRDEHPVDCDRAGGWRDAGAAGDHGEHALRMVACTCHRTCCWRATDAMKGDPRLQPMAFRPERTSCRAKLPDGAHRVVSGADGAKMRSMMQGHCR